MKFYSLNFLSIVDCINTFDWYQQQKHKQHAHSLTLNQNIELQIVDGTWRAKRFEVFRMKLYTATFGGLWMLSHENTNTNSTNIQHQICEKWINKLVDMENNDIHVIETSFIHRLVLLPFHVFVKKKPNKRSSNNNNNYYHHWVLLSQKKSGQNNTKSITRDTANHMTYGMKLSILLFAHSISQTHRSRHGRTECERVRDQEDGHRHM